MKKQKAKFTYQIKISLMGVKPPIWRTVLVPSNLDLGTFHILIQIAMGWSGGHLHQFIANRVFYGTPDPDFDFEIKDEKRYQLADLLVKEKDTLLYEYDFGDGWEHKVLLEKMLPIDSTIDLPVCLKAKRNCPPEDCGGIWGYAELLNTLADPKHPDYDDMIEWLDGEFDSEYVSLEEINDELSGLRSKIKASL